MKEDKVSPSPRFDELASAARLVRDHAYAPFSRYLVGAALLGEDGQIYVGCNVENSSYGLTLCAERVAIGAMIAAGCAHWLEIVVVTEDGGTPCGMCRQTLWEHAATNDAFVSCVSASGNLVSHSIGELLPAAFKLRK